MHDGEILPAETLPILPLEPSPAACEILNALHRVGFEGYAVGGGVRDLLCGRLPQDWDICTNALPEQVIAVFGAEDTLTTGLRHGTVTIKRGGQLFEVTTFRADGCYRDKRHPQQVQFVSSLHKDLSRRDFTINAIAMDVNGEIFDPLGGCRDINAEQIRCVGVPAKRFQEDALRILRALRLAATLEFSVDEETAAAIHQYKSSLSCVSIERQTQEFCKLLLGDDAPRVLLEFYDVVLEVIPELECLTGREYENWRNLALALWHTAPQLPLRLAVLFCNSNISHLQKMEIAQRSLNRLRLDTRTKKQVLSLLTASDLPLCASKRAVLHALNQLGAALFQDVLAMREACAHVSQQVASELAQIKKIEHLTNEILAAGQCYSLKQLAVNGADILAAGIAMGPEIGTILTALLTQVLEQTLPNEKDSLLHWAKKHFKK